MPLSLLGLPKRTELINAHTHWILRAPSLGCGETDGLAALRATAITTAWTLLWFEAAIANAAALLKDNDYYGPRPHYVTHELLVLLRGYPRARSLRVTITKSLDSESWMGARLILRTYAPVQPYYSQ